MGVVRQQWSRRFCTSKWSLSKLRRRGISEPSSTGSGFWQSQRQRAGPELATSRRKRRR